ncbi:MAG TPA: hypothetical protein VK816_05895 [Jatrophihabitantaceae bacterium]|jgi:hypothetical protein|nr:hypothetical protein [Jatrophihabitantaceae bacterium]
MTGQTTPSCGETSNPRRPFKRILTGSAITISLLCTFLLAIFTPAGTTHSSAQPPGEWLYRIETSARSPIDILGSGFRSRGVNTDLVEHVLGTSTNNGTSAFISMTTDRRFALRWMTEGLSPANPAPAAQNGIETYWLYQIRPSSLMTDAIASLRATDQAQATARYGDNDPWRQRINSTINAFEFQHEWDATYTLPATTIYSATRVDYDTRTGEITEGQVLENPSYLAAPPDWTGEPIIVDRPANPLGPAYWYGTPRNETDSPTNSEDFGWSSAMFCDDTASTSTRQRRDSTESTISTGCANLIQYSYRKSGVPAYDRTRSMTVTISTPYAWSTGCTYKTHCQMLPSYCSISQEKDGVIKAACTQNPGFSSYQLMVGAGGSSNTYVNQDFQGSIHIPVFFSGSNLTDRKNGGTISDSGYSMGDVFFSGRSWWSNLTIKPVFG